MKRFTVTSLTNHPDNRHTQRDASESGKQPKLLDRVRAAMLADNLPEGIVARSFAILADFIRFHKLRHPKEMAELEASAFLSDLRFVQKASSQKQTEAYRALQYLYERILEQPLDEKRIRIVAPIVSGSDEAQGAYAPRSPAQGAYAPDTGHKVLRESWTDSFALCRKVSHQRPCPRLILMP